MDSYKDVLFFRYSAERDQPTFGQRCRRIVLEVFYELIHKIHHWSEIQILQGFDEFTPTIPRK
jgi:hypothetical protein